MELLIVIIDCCAVIAKVTSGTSAYDRVVQAEKYGAIRRAERDEAFTDTEIRNETRVHDAWWQALGDAAVESIAAWRGQARDAGERAGQQDATAPQGGQPAGGARASGAARRPAPQGGQTGRRAAGRPVPSRRPTAPMMPPAGLDGRTPPHRRTGRPGRRAGQQAGPEPPGAGLSEPPPSNDPFTDADPFAAIRDRLGWEEQT